MKPLPRKALIAGLTPVFRALALVSRYARLDGWAQVIRYIRWKGKLAKLGDDTHIYPDVVIRGAKHVVIGSRCAIAEFVHIWGGGHITIGDDVLIASHAVITSLTHDTEAARFRESLVRAPVMIGDNVWIGAGAIILRGVTLGTGCAVGAGAVVTRDVPPRVVVTGIPAKTTNELRHKNKAIGRRELV